jgi:DNA-binding response OmpR family regulator
MTQAMPAQGADPLLGRRVLLVEDESMIAMLIEDMLSEHGAVVLGPAKRLDAALALAGSEAIDLGVLDLNLAGEAVYPVAEALAQRGVPFLFMTGYGQLGIAERWRDRPSLAKPFRPSQLADALRGLLATDNR